MPVLGGCQRPGEAKRHLSDAVVVPCLFFLFFLFLVIYSLSRKTLSHALSATRSPFPVLTMGLPWFDLATVAVFPSSLTPIVVIPVIDKNFKAPF